MMIIVSPLVIILIIGIIGIIIRRVINNSRENNLINTVLSKLDFCPDSYKITRKGNRIIIRCHCLIDNKMIYNDSSLGKSFYDTLNGGLKLVDIIINMDDMEYKIIISAFHIINTNINFYKELKERLKKPSYYFINNIIDKDFNIDYNDVSLCNIISHNIYTETAKYDKYICRNYNIILTDDREFIYFHSLSYKYNTITYQPLLSNEIRIKELECCFL